MNPENADPRLRAVLDTNIYIAAFGHPFGSTAELWTAALTGRYCLLISPPMIRELAKVLRTGLRWPEDRIQRRIRGRTRTGTLATAAGYVPMVDSLRRTS